MRWLGQSDAPPITEDQVKLLVKMRTTVPPLRASQHADGGNGGGSGDSGPSGVKRRKKDGLNFRQDKYGYNVYAL